MTDEQVLKHYGVLGMKWGKRKGSSDSPEGPKSDDHNRKVALKKKHLSEMSNQELKDLNNRLQLERQYKDLTKKDVSPGKKLAKAVLADIGKDVAKDILSPVKEQGKKAARKQVAKFVKSVVEYSKKK